MVRTKADSCPAAGRKVVAARAPRKNVGASSSAGSSSSTSLGASPAGKYAGGNPVCPRPTPEWQKGISSFFSKKPSNKENQEPGASEEEPGCSGSSSDSAACQPGASGAGSSSSQPSAGSTESPSKTQAASEDEDES